MPPEDKQAEEARLRHVVVTGATGFLGQAVLERLLSDYDDVVVSLLIRARTGQPVEERCKALLRKPVFRTWKANVGSEAAERVYAERVRAIEGDMTDGPPPIPADAETIIHCASTVSFDPPIDEAFRTNVLGVMHLYEAALASPAKPHVVHVSTAYVAGARKGVVPEARLDHNVQWRAELDAALEAREQVERDSRRPEFLRSKLKESGAVHGKAGPQTTAQAAELMRVNGVADRLIDYGRTRARSLGWPDVYTFTKALGERAGEELGAGLPVSIVRPAIVESALQHPYAGWIDGFKMAEPIILAYGRGVLPEFPGAADGILDVVPVDIVTNALIAVAENPPEVGTPQYFHVGSGSRNPLTFADLYELVLEYFTDNPLPDTNRGAIQVPSWSFPGSRRVDRLLRTGERLTDLAEKTLLHLPANDRTRGWMSKNHRQQQQLEFLRRYADLYGVYTEIEVIYSDDKLLALHQSQSPERQRDAGFDTAVVDWRHYLVEVHCPAVTKALRLAGRRGAMGSRPRLPHRDDVVAVFDLEGTLLASNVIESYLWARLGDQPTARWAGDVASLAKTLPRLFVAERRDRTEFLRTFMRHYEGASEAEFRKLVDDRLANLLFHRAAPDALRQVRRHREAGHQTILITGTLRQLVEPMSTLFDIVVASELQVRDGRFTGYLAMPPLVGEARAAWLRRHASETGADLAKSYAYGDSFSDRPLLEAVGHPIAVNPDPRLYRHAKARRWQIEQWGRHTRGPIETMVEAAR
jgi:alcohol-forming fatty acyl-CoA reductase